IVKKAIAEELKRYDLGKDYSLAERMKYGVYTWVEDTTAITIPSQPVWAALEATSTILTGSHTPTHNLLEARIKGAALGYLGLGVLYTAGRNISMNITHPKNKKLHDFLYTGAYTVLVCTAIYASSHFTLRESVTNMAAATGISLAVGPFYGWAIDKFKEYMEPLRSKMKKNPCKHKRKIAIAILMIALSAAAMGGIYLAKDYVDHNSISSVKVGTKPTTE
ncbi:MAG: hypothetical protein V1718_04200, partial [archaeon]